jgi:triosephosphate isomerase
VWSIGTGRNASAEIAQDICAYIRGLLREQYGPVAEQIRILYGGSVKPDNVKTYLSTADIDGALVGGASLSIESFKDLINNMI